MQPLTLDEIKVLNAGARQVTGNTAVGSSARKKRRSRKELVKRATGFSTAQRNAERFHRSVSCRCFCGRQRHGLQSGQDPRVVRQTFGQEFQRADIFPT